MTEKVSARSSSKNSITVMFFKKIFVIKSYIQIVFKFKLNVCLFSFCDNVLLWTDSSVVSQKKCKLYNSRLQGLKSVGCSKKIQQHSWASCFLTLHGRELETSPLVKFLFSPDGPVLSNRKKPHSLWHWLCIRSDLNSKNRDHVLVTVCFLPCSCICTRHAQPYRS